MQKLYPEDERLTKVQIHRLVKRFEQTGSVQDNRHNNKIKPQFREHYRDTGRDSGDACSPKKRH